MSKNPLWTVTAAPDATVETVAAALRAAGLAVTEVLAEIGVVQGRAPKTLLARLRQVKGVADVSPSMDVDIGPPDSAVS